MPIIIIICNIVIKNKMSVWVPKRSGKLWINSPRLSVRTKVCQRYISVFSKQSFQPLLRYVIKIMQNKITNKFVTHTNTHTLFLVKPSLPDWLLQNLVSGNMPKHYTGK